MRIVIDLQACQSLGSRVRGIGRYSASIAKAMIGRGTGHEFWIALNGALPESIEDIRADFDALLPQDRIVVWDNPFPGSEYMAPEPWRIRMAEVLREDFLRTLRPDLVHVSSLFEGLHDPVVTSIGRSSGPVLPTAVTLYDLIPLAMESDYLQNPPTRKWYQRKLGSLRRADLLLAISQFSLSQAKSLLRLDDARLANISGAADPLFRVLPADSAREVALRARLGVWRSFVMYAGGFDSRKNVAGLIRAYASLPPSLRQSRQLVVVGEPLGTIRAELDAVARKHGLAADELRFVGFVNDADLVGLYNACELYVFPSRSEGFGLPALEAMACGAPVIAADTSSLPEVIGYPDAMFDATSDAAMAERIGQALSDPGYRARLIAHGKERVRLFSWEASADRALDAIAAWSLRQAGAAPGPDLDPVMDAPGPGRDDPRLGAIGRQSRALARELAGHDPGAAALRRLAAAQSTNTSIPGRPRQLLLDVSELSARDARTGIQRVVRNILGELLQAPPPGFEVAAMRFDADGSCRYARAFVHRLLGRGGPPPEDAVVDARQGDVFLGLDLSAHLVPGQEALLARWRRHGVALYFVVYDLVPLLRPDVVQPNALPLFRQWYPVIARLADGLCCISAAVARELLEWCDQERPSRLRPLHLGHFHLGADLDAGTVSGHGAAPPPDWLSTRPTLLMVGTLEPRKGYAQALAAMEVLWAGGEQVNLAIVGKPGWMMDDFARKLRRHPEFGRRLQWFESANDAELCALYIGSSGLLMASESEGFGLPIIEAARHGLAVVARDLPVFREIAAGHAYWFSGYAADDLAAALRSWLTLFRRGAAPSPEGVRQINWAESRRQLLALVMDGGWDATWMPGPRYLFPASDPRLLLQVGVRDRQSLRSDGRAGFLVYGPYASLPAGRYRLEVRGAWEHDGDAYCDVMVGKGRNRLAHRDIRAADATRGMILLDTLELASDVFDLEVRLWVSESVGLRIDAIELHSIDAAT